MSPAGQEFIWSFIIVELTGQLVRNVPTDLEEPREAPMHICLWERCCRAAAREVLESCKKPGFKLSFNYIIVSICCHTAFGKISYYTPLGALVMRKNK